MTPRAARRGWARGAMCGTRPATRRSTAQECDRQVGTVPTMNAMVMLDVDGVLADMNAFEHLIATSPKNWRAFFEHGHDAALVPAGAQLAATLQRLGFHLVYSTTRPPWCGVMTKEWIQAQQLPKGYVYIRDKNDSSTATSTQVKQRHYTTAAQFYRTPLMAFIDDETTVVENLRTAGVPAHTLTELTTATDDQVLALATALR